MWGHYANNHSGFCIGLNTDYIRTIRADYLGKIEYTKKYPVILPRFANDENLKQQVFTKSIAWKYEQEYRLFYKKVTDRVVKIEKEAIEKVYLGANMDKLSKDKWIDLLYEYMKHVKIYEGTTDKESFKLRFKRIL